LPWYLTVVTYMYTAVSCAACALSMCNCKSFNSCWTTVDHTHHLDLYSAAMPSRRNCLIIIRVRKGKKKIKRY